MTTGKAGRPHWWASGLVAFLCLAIATVAWLAIKPDTYVAPAPRAVQAAARPDLAATALDELERAVSGRNSAAARALGADDRARALLGAVVSNAGAIDVADFSARYVDETGAIAPNGRWTAAVDLSWRFAGYDTAPVHTEVAVGFAVLDGTAGITGIGGERGAARSG